MKNIILIFFSIVFTPIFSLDKVVPKFCVNCKHFLKPVHYIGDSYGRCSFFPQIDDGEFYVTGTKSIYAYNYCTTARQCENMCGKEGKKYESKDGEDKISEIFINLNSF